MQIKKYISKNEEKQYITVPFDVEGDIEKLEVCYKVDDESATIDIGIEDPNGIRGYSGGARDSFYITKHHATPGYMAGELNKGVWKVILGTYEIPDDGCNVTIQIQATKKHWQWLKGDTHTHTTHSDGSYSLEEAYKIMIDGGMDYLICTDHNIYTQNNNITTDKELIVIPGFEMTTFKGHVNMVGVTRPINDFRVITQQEVTDALLEARENGAYIGINHPFCDKCPWLYDFDLEKIDWVELCNGPIRDVNYAAIAWWQEKLAQGYKIPIVGGSDTHSPHPFIKHGIPTTYVYAHSYTMEGVLDGMNNGHSYFTIFDIRANLTTDNNIMGDTTSDDTVYIHLENLIKNDKVSIITEKGVVEEHVANQSGMLSLSYEIKDSLFVRVEVGRFIDFTNRVETMTVTNPIYRAK